ncbi:HAD hydrolase-like protein [Rossellomorea vietnamensis]|uniref:HAD hydrolase-like protein n=1 Tax=Rossellomorea vietnamensis TaxID=218284 RepID=UPI003D29FCF3
MVTAIVISQKTKTVFIGDVGSTDMLAAHTVGAMKVLVLTGWGQGSLNQYRDNWAEVEPDYVAENLLDAVKWVISKNEE